MSLFKINLVLGLLDSFFSFVSWTANNGLLACYIRIKDHRIYLLSNFLTKVITETPIISFSCRLQCNRIFCYCFKMAQLFDDFLSCLNLYFYFVVMLQYKEENKNEMIVSLSRKSVWQSSSFKI